MNTYISLLRGINVSGQKPVRMDRLAAIYESLGCKHVQTYIQSGNVVFQHAAKDSSHLVERLKKGIRDTFGFEVVVLLRTVDDFERVIKNNPFSKKDENRVYVTFLDAQPAHFPREEINKATSKEEEINIMGREAYLSCPNGYGRTKLSNAFVEKKLEVAATTRNWRTVTALLALAKKTPSSPQQ